MRRRLNLLSGLYEFRNDSIKSSQLNKNTEVIVLVITRWNAVENRNVLRDVFKSVKQSDLSMQYKLLFLFNYPQNLTKSDVLQLAEENQKYEDLLMPNVDDNYKTVAFKLLAAFRWLSHVPMPQFKWLVKIDDDVILDLTNLDIYLSESSSNENAIHCYVNTGSPMRDIKDKW